MYIFYCKILQILTFREICKIRPQSLEVSKNLEISELNPDGMIPI